MSRHSGFAAIKSVLAVRNYRVFTIGNLVSHLGTWVQRVAVGYLTWQLTESFAWLGIMAFADLFPTVLLAPLTGAIADRVDRVRLMRAMQTLNLVQASLLAVLTLGGWITVEALLVLVMIGGVIVSFNQPARLAIVPSLVPRPDLAAAIGLNSMVFNLARFVGPMIAGFLIDAHGAGAAFAFNAVTFLWFLVTLYMLRVADSGRRRAPRRHIAGDIAAGFSYAAKHPGIGPMLVMLTVVAICARPYVELLPGYADRVFGLDARGLATLYSAIGLGAMLGGLWLAQRGTILGLTSVVVTASLALAASLIAFASVQTYWLALPILVCTGFAMVVIGVGEQTLIQNAVDPELRGRVLGFYGMIGRGAPALGALIMGGASSYVGPQWPIAGGALLVVVMWLWAIRIRRTMARELEVEPAG